MQFFKHPEDGNVYIMVYFCHEYGVISTQTITREEYIGEKQHWMLENPNYSVLGTLACPIAADFDPRPAQIAMFEKKLEEARAEFRKKEATIQEAIASLRAIGYESPRDEGQDFDSTYDSIP